MLLFISTMDSLRKDILCDAFKSKAQEPSKTDSRCVFPVLLPAFSCGRRVGPGSLNKFGCTKSWTGDHFPQEAISDGRGALNLAFVDRLNRADSPALPVYFEYGRGNKESNYSSIQQQTRSTRSSNSFSSLPRRRHKEERGIQSSWFDERCGRVGRSGAVWICPPFFESCRDLGSPRSTNKKVYA
jgi:hypothetical protein